MTTAGRRRWLHTALAFACAGCAARYVRFDEKGLTCLEAQHLAVATVQRMGYTVEHFNDASPGAPGVITGSRGSPSSPQRVLVQVFCTTTGSRVEAKSEQGGIDALSFAGEFRRSFETVAAHQAPPRPPAESGVDVLLAPAHGAAAEIGVDLIGLGILPVSVRITNHTGRAYRFRAAGVRLETAAGESVPPLAVAKVTPQLDSNVAQKLRHAVLGTADLTPGGTLTGLLLFPFGSYSRARVELTDRSAGETEGFAIDF